MWLRFQTTAYVWPSYNYRNAIALIEKDTGPGNYVIVKEGKVVTGTATNNNKQVNTEQTFGGNLKTINNTTTTTDVTEYRIAYRRKNAAAVPMLPGGGGGVQPTGFAQPPGGPGFVQPAGGVVPNVGPGGGAYPAGGFGRP